MIGDRDEEEDGKSARPDSRFTGSVHQVHLSTNQHINKLTFWIVYSNSIGSTADALPYTFQYLVTAET